MRKLSLLEIVQSTLGSMDSDAVNTIGETIESEQIALNAKEQYLELATYQRVPQFEELTQLIGLANSDRATVMKIPDDCTDIKEVRYKKTHTGGQTTFEPVCFMPKDEFLDMQLKLRVGDEEVGENIFDDNIRIPYRNDRSPCYWTTFDDEHIVFDSIDKEVQKDDTLHNDNSLVLAYIIPPFELRDDFTPDIPVKLYSQYLNMIKEVSSYEQRQINNEVRTRRSERQGHRNRHFGSITDGSDQGHTRARRDGRIQGLGRRYGRGSASANTRRFTL